LNTILSRRGVNRQASRAIWRTAVVFAMALACCGCVGRPLQGVLIPASESADNTSRVPILVATTRGRAAVDTGDMFSSEPARALAYGRVTISIPPDDAREVGEIQWPSAPPGNPRNEFVTVSADYLDEKGFGAAVGSIAKATRRSKAMVFVHGFNNRFDDAVYRLAQIVQDSGLPVIPVLFSWPSRGVIALGAYEYDREAARQSSASLEELLDMLARQPSIREVTVLCHSMGCLLTLKALNSMAARVGRIGNKIRNVVFVAPDVGVDVFRQQIQEMGTSRPRFALFLSQDDAALKISRSISGGATRLGDINPEEEPYKSELDREKIVVFDLTHLGGDAHSRAFDSVTSVMGMIERRLARRQQFAEDTSRRPVAATGGQ
jgi:esterase/lipase superfamily enzyme